MPNTDGQLTHARQEAFLAAFSECGVVSISAEAAGIARSSVYAWKQADEFFAKAFDEAEQRAHEVLVNEARRRGKEGYDEYIVSGGKLVRDEDGNPLFQRRFSDQLLKFLIERREGKPVQRLEHGSEIVKPKEIEPAYVAEVLAELDRRRALAPGETPN